ASCRRSPKDGTCCKHRSYGGRAAARRVTSLQCAHTKMLGWRRAEAFGRRRSFSTSRVDPIIVSRRDLVFELVQMRASFFGALVDVRRNIAFGQRVTELDTQEAAGRVARH